MHEVKLSYAASTVSAMKKPPQKSAQRELSEVAAEGVLNMVPVVGGALALAVTYARGLARNQRAQEWLADLAAAVEDLQDRGAAPPLDELVKDEVFLDAVIHATRAAQATHQAEKLDALQHAVLHSFGPEAPDVDEQRRFFRLVDQFSPGHLRMLSFLADPGGALERAGIAPEQYMAAGRSAALERLPEFSGKRDWYDLLAGDLSAAGLAQPNLHAVMTGAGVYQDSTTQLGKRFLGFIDASAAS